MNTTAENEFTIIDEDFLCRLLRRKDCHAHVVVRDWRGNGPTAFARLDKKKACDDIARGCYEGFVAASYGEGTIYLNATTAPAWLVAKRSLARLAREIAYHEKKIADFTARGGTAYLTYAESYASRLIELRRQLAAAEHLLARHRGLATATPVAA